MDLKKLNKVLRESISILRTESDKFRDLPIYGDAIPAGSTLIKKKRAKKDAIFKPVLIKQDAYRTNKTIWVRAMGVYEGGKVVRSFEYTRSGRVQLSLWLKYTDDPVVEDKITKYRKGTINDLPALIVR